MRTLWWCGRLVLLAFGLVVVGNVVAPAVARAQFVASGGASAAEVLAALVGQTVTASKHVATSSTDSGFACNNALGSCLDTGPGSCNSVGTDGSGALVLGGTACAPTVKIGGSGNVTLLGTGGIQLVNTGLDVNNNSTITNSATGKPIWINEENGLYLMPYSAATLPTCGTSGVPEGTVRTVLAAGSSRTRICLCTSDGAGTPAYEWRNLFAPTTAGTATTCPVTP